MGGRAGGAGKTGNRLSVKNGDAGADLLQLFRLWNKVLGWNRALEPMKSLRCAWCHTLASVNKTVRKRLGAASFATPDETRVWLEIGVTPINLPAGVRGRVIRQQGWTSLSSGAATGHQACRQHFSLVPITEIVSELARPRD